MKINDQEGVPTGLDGRREWRFRFGECLFDGRSLDLSVAGAPVKLERKPLEVLWHLLQHAGEVVTKQELLDAVWDGRILSDAVLTKAMARLRQGLRDESQALIKTIHGYGYRLIAPVQVEASGPQPLLPALPELEVDGVPPLRPLWRLERRLGAGGSGEVWCVRHAKTGERRVFKFALDPDSLTSLKREITLQRVLADSLGPRADFVRLLDWNLEESPFYVEYDYVEGGSLLDWAATEGGLAQVPMTQRLEMVAQIADALAAAHSVGVLHKDLKAGNVLVDVDATGAPQVRLADFGSGRLIDLARLEALEITRMGFTVADAAGADSGGTLLYLAPEVLAGQPPTARSDIYALGVLLYQMLAGDNLRPFAPGWEQHVDDPLLCEDIAAAAAGEPAARLGDASELARRLRTLDARREARQREQDLHEEAERMRRTLALSAARRRRWVMASGVLGVVLCVVAGLLLQVRSARQQAESEARIAAAVNRFLTDDLLGQANPLVSGRSDVQVRDLLDAAAREVGSRFPEQPATEASVRLALGRAYLNLGEFDKAQRQLETALEIAPAQAGQVELEVEVRTDLAKLWTRKGDQARARQMLAPLLTHADPAVRARAGLDDAFALLHAGDAAGALAALDRLLPAVVSQFGDSATESLTARVYRANAQRELGNYDAAIADYRQALAGREALHGRGHIATLEAMRGLGGALFLAERHEQALPVLQSAHVLAGDVLGKRHDHTLTIASDLSLVLQSLKRYPEAEALMLATLDARAADYGHDSSDYRSLLNNLGVLYGETGNLQRQYDYLQRSCEAEHAVAGATHPNTLICDHNLARALVDLGRYREAEALERRTMAQAPPVFGDSHFFIGVVGYTYAAIVGRLGRTAESEQRFEAAIALLDKALGPGNERTRQAIALREQTRRAGGAAAAGASAR